MPLGSSGKNRPESENVFQFELRNAWLLNALMDSIVIHLFFGAHVSSEDVCIDKL